MTDSYRLLVRCAAKLGCIPTTAAAIGTLRLATNKGKEFLFFIGLEHYREQGRSLIAKTLGGPKEKEPKDDHWAFL